MDSRLFYQSRGSSYAGPQLGAAQLPPTAPARTLQGEPRGSSQSWLLASAPLPSPLMCARSLLQGRGRKRRAHAGGPGSILSARRFPEHCQE